MMILSRLNARDRALFHRWALLDTASRKSRMSWLALTHLGGATTTVAAAVLPLRAGGSIERAAHGALLTLVLSHILVQFVKRTVGRPRPTADGVWRSLASVPDRFSFPSGHSAAAMSIAFAYALSFPSIAPVLIPLAVLVGLSRVVLGVHYPGDVLIGQLLAILVGIIMVR
jgi:undecaprenyl-diphosphatase